MCERSPHIGGAVRPPREQDNTPNQAAPSVQYAIPFNATNNLLQHHPCHRVNAGSRKVVVREFDTPRRTLIDRVLLQCGVQAYHVEESGDIEKAPYSSCCAAVIALGTYLTDDTLVSRIICRMRAAGLTVIAHEGGARSWSVGQRCRALLAGASCILDSEEAAGYFDAAAIKAAPQNEGEEVEVARHVLHPQYCGTLLYFMQYAEPARTQRQVVLKTPGYEWVILCNNQPRDPYLPTDLILNPWGYNAPPIHLRLEEGCTLRFVVRRTASPVPLRLAQVGGRLLGRTWYNTRYGGAPNRL